MVTSLVSKTVKEIKSLKIQGASKIREKAVIALVDSVKKSKAKNSYEFRKEFLKNSKDLFYARPTEPALRTAIRILKQSISEKHLSVEDMKNKILKTAREYEMKQQEALNNIAKYGAKMIEKNSTILIHCHSHSVIDVLKKAKNKIKKVYCTETRPLFQGRISIKELTDAGIDATLIIDGAASTVLKKCDYFFSGADAILADGDLINKIGTNQISIAAKEYSTKHYVFCSTHKFEPTTFFGKEEKIEQRDTKEIWEKKPKNIKIMNSAFDRTDSKYIEGIVSEIGIFPPEQFANQLYNKLDLSKHKSKFLKTK
jgi:ribose 1,5-bisphosphate isomerase